MDVQEGGVGGIARTYIYIYHVTSLSLSLYFVTTQQLRRVTRVVTIPLQALQSVSKLLSTRTLDDVTLWEEGDPLKPSARRGGVGCRVPGRSGLERNPLPSSRSDRCGWGRLEPSATWRRGGFRPGRRARRTRDGQSIAELSEPGGPTASASGNRAAPPGFAPVTGSGTGRK